MVTGSSGASPARFMSIRGAPTGPRFAHSFSAALRASTLPALGLPLPLRTCEHTPFFGFEGGKGLVGEHVVVRDAEGVQFSFPLLLLVKVAAPPPEGSG
jgi:hypothetical protein